MHLVNVGALLAEAMVLSPFYTSTVFQFGEIKTP